MCSMPPALTGGSAPPSSCSLCQAIVLLPHLSISVILTTRAKDHSRSFRVEMGNVSDHSSSTASCGNNLPIYSLDSFEYHIDEEVEAIVSCAMPMSTKTAVL
uniref:Uncharacterized protein n=1 Tax=Oryza glumipatula TaxID=40148 RepID=A0A0D9Z6E3_9ORYZ